MRVSPQCVHSLGGLRQGTRGRLRLWGRLSWPRGSSRVPPPPGVLFHPPSLDPPPSEVNLANIVVHGGIIEQIQDQQREHEEAVNPHSQKRRVVVVHVALGAGREVCLHDRLELRLVAAVFEDSVVMVTAEDEGFVVREPGAVEAKVVAAFVIRVRLTDPEMCGQDCRKQQGEYCEHVPGPLATTGHHPAGIDPSGAAGKKMTTTPPRLSGHTGSAKPTPFSPRGSKAEFRTMWPGPQ